jgi:hypothetical protein
MQVKRDFIARPEPKPLRRHRRLIDEKREEYEELLESRAEKDQSSRFE